MPTAKHNPLPRASLLALPFALLLAAGTAGCRSSARDEYMAARNIRIAPTEAGDEPAGVAGVNPDAPDPAER